MLIRTCVDVHTYARTVHDTQHYVNKHAHSGAIYAGLDIVLHEDTYGRSLVCVHLYGSSFTHTYMHAYIHVHADEVKNKTINE